MHDVAEAKFYDDAVRTTGALNDLSLHLFPAHQMFGD